MATTADDVWQLMAELTTVQKKTDRQLKELGKQTIDNGQLLIIHLFTNWSRFFKIGHRRSRFSVNCYRKNHSTM